MNVSGHVPLENTNALTEINKTKKKPLMSLGAISDLTTGENLDHYVSNENEARMVSGAIIGTVGCALAVTISPAAGIAGSTYMASNFIRNMYRDRSNVDAKIADSQNDLAVMSSIMNILSKEHSHEDDDDCLDITKQCRAICEQQLKNGSVLKQFVNTLIDTNEHRMQSLIESEMNSKQISAFKQLFDYVMSNKYSPSVSEIKECCDVVAEVLGMKGEEQFVNTMVESFRQSYEDNIGPQNNHSRIQQRVAMKDRDYWGVDPDLVADIVGKYQDVVRDEFYHYDTE